MVDEQNGGHGDVERDVLNAELSQLRELMTARLLDTNNLTEAIAYERKLLATGDAPLSAVERRLTVAEANQIAESLTGGAMHIVETQGKLELRGANAGSGVQLFPYLTTRTGVAATVMEYFASQGSRAPQRHHSTGWANRNAAATCT